MKIRSDFVTNSSSSSYICEICGADAYGYDLGLDDAEMTECVNGHIFCDEHRLPVTKTKEELIKAILENQYNYNDEEKLNGMNVEDLIEEIGHYDVPEFLCPICQFIEYSESDLADYLLKEYGISRDTVFAEVKKLNKRRRKLYDSEYITYVCQQYHFNPVEIVSQWKEKFGTYEMFKKYIRN